jgi:hypothetical protein
VAPRYVHEQAVSEPEALREQVKVLQELVRWICEEEGTAIFVGDDLTVAKTAFGEVAVPSHLEPTLLEALRLTRGL